MYSNRSGVGRQGPCSDSRAAKKAQSEARKRTPSTPPGKHTTESGVNSGTKTGTNSGAQTDSNAVSDAGSNGSGTTSDAACDAANRPRDRLEPREQTYFLNRHGGSAVDRRPPFKKVLGALQNAHEVAPGQWIANCPCPDCHDTGEHLNVYQITDGRGKTLSDGDVVLRCFHAGQEGGCTLEEILEALHLEMDDLFAQGPDDAKRPSPCKQVTARRETPLCKTLKRTISPKPGELRTAPDAARDWADMAKQFQAALPPRILKGLAQDLGLTPASLESLYIGHADHGFTFPEFSGAGDVVGISLRTFAGGKLMFPGSRRGIYIPRQWCDRDDPLLIVEGASDVAAATMLGFAALGRPDCSSGAKLLAEAILTANQGDITREFQVVVLGENDAKPDGRWPGKTGAIKVAEDLAWHLGQPVGWALPDRAKDLRAWVAATREGRDHDE